MVTGVANFSFLKADNNHIWFLSGCVATEQQLLHVQVSLKETEEQLSITQIKQETGGE